MPTLPARPSLQHLRKQAKLPPLLALLRHSTGAPADVRRCAELLLDAGSGANSRSAENGGEWYRSSLFEAVERRDLTLARLLVERGADLADCAFDDEGPLRWTARSGAR